MQTFTVRFTIPNGEYEGDRAQVQRQLCDDLQALLYDNGDGATRDAIAGQFDFVADQVPA